MRLLALILIALTAGTLAACQPELRETHGPPEGPFPETTSLVMLLSRPEVYDGRYVLTQGVINTNYGDGAIFLSREDFDAFRTVNAIRVGMDRGHDDESLRALHGRSVTVAGIFHDGVGADLHGPGVLIAQSIQSNPTGQQLTYWRTISMGPVFGMPWLMLMGLLIATTASLALAWAVPRNARRSTVPKPIWWGLLGYATLFVGWEAYLACRFLPEAFGMGIPVEFAIVTVGTAVGGALGLVGMWLSWRADRRGLVLWFVALQLLFPVVREVRRIDTWEGQLRYPFIAGHVTRYWESPTWPQDQDGWVRDYEDLNLPPPAYREEPASSTLEPSPTAPQ